MHTLLFLVRHGATKLTAQDRFAGSLDVPLSEAGRLQARRLCARLGTEHFDGIYASPLQRARDTAAILAEGRPQRVVVDGDLREVEFGKWEGLRRDEIRRSTPVEFAEWEADPYFMAPPGGESGVTAVQRVVPAIIRIVRRHSGGKVLIVSHKSAIRLLVGSLLGLDPRTCRDCFDQQPAALNILEFSNQGRVRIRLMNDVSHYQSDNNSLTREHYDHVVPQTAFAA